jgi:uncharacterized SAM-binding protein YcdF (DUF218 family)/lysophospholipase L1-like esterase
VTSVPTGPAPNGPAAAAPRRRRFRRDFLFGVLATLAVIYGGSAIILYTHLADYAVGPLLSTATTGDADAIVVAGAGVTGPCVPNNYAVRRAMLAARLWRQGRAPFILFTGGHEPSLDCPISDVMGGLASELGVPPDRIQTERASRNTHENAVLSAPILRAQGVKRIILVTDRLHMWRCGAVFEQQGFVVERAPVPVYESHTDNLSMLRAGLREYLALGYYWKQGWLASPIEPRRASGGAPVLELARATDGADAGLIVPVAYRTSDMSQSAPQGARHQVVILGASYAAGWNPIVPGVTIVNKGVAGQETFALRDRFARDVVELSPRAVIIWGFVNDVFRAPRPQIASRLDRTRANLREMIAQARAKGIEPILATEVTVRPPLAMSETITSWIGWMLGKESYQDYVNGHVAAVNQWIRDLARDEHLLLLDLQPVLADGSGVRKREFSKDDGSHISPAGYAALSAYAQPRLAAHFAAVK